MNALTGDSVINSIKLKGMDFFVFTIPLLGLVKISLVGELFVNELILILVVPFFIISNRASKNKGLLNSVLFMAGLWLFGQVLTDSIRSTPFEDYARGWAKIIFFSGVLFVLSRLITDPVRALLWVSASSVPILFRPFQLFEDYDWFILWKFGIGPALLTIAILPSLWRLLKDPDDNGLFKRIALLHYVFGIGSFFMNARSFAGLAILTGLLAWFYPMYRGQRLSAGRISIFLGVLLIGAITLINVYSLGARSGFFGEEARNKYESQVMYSNSTLDILIGGRSESLVSTIAISDSPIIGHGSWAKNYQYVALYLEMRARFSEADQNGLYSESMTEGLIPSHSYLLGAWVEAGIFGALFWGSVIYICVFKVIPAAIERSDVLGLLALLALPLFFWNILFSPFGANVRVEAAGIITILLLAVTSPFQKHK